MKNPFSKKTKVIDIAPDLNAQIDKPAVMATDPAPSRPSLTKQGAAPKRGPTVASHGFEYSDDTVDDAQDNVLNDTLEIVTQPASALASDDAAISNTLINEATIGTAAPNAALSSEAGVNPYRFNETDTDADNTAIVTNHHYNDSKWYSLNGRIGRVKFMAYTFIWGLLFSIPYLILLVLMFGMSAVGLDGATGRGIARIAMGITVLSIIPIAAYYIVIIPRRRLHDQGKSGLWILIYFIPIVSLIMMYWLYLKPGDTGGNLYGQPPAPNTRAETVLAAAAPVLLILMVVAAVVLPMTLDNSAEESLASDVDSVESVQSIESTEAPTSDPSEGGTDAVTVQEEEVGSTALANDDNNANSVELKTNEQLDPEVQAEIDAALSNSSPAASPNSSTPAPSSGNTNDASYEEFIRASETPILLDDSPDPTADKPSAQ